MLSMSRIAAAAGTRPICTAYLTISEIASFKLTAQQNNWYQHNIVVLDYFWLCFHNRQSSLYLLFTWHGLVRLILTKIFEHLYLGRGQWQMTSDELNDWILLFSKCKAGTERKAVELGSTTTSNGVLITRDNRRGLADRAQPNHRYRQLGIGSS